MHNHPQRRVKLKQQIFASALNICNFAVNYLSAENLNCVAGQEPRIEHFTLRNYLVFDNRR
jgi:hypothetical protein